MPDDMNVGMKIDANDAVTSKSTLSDEFGLVWENLKNWAVKITPQNSMRSVCDASDRNSELWEKL